MDTAASTTAYDWCTAGFRSLGALQHCIPTNAAMCVVPCRPHLDDGTLKGAWRNGLLMEPTVKYGEFRCAMLVASCWWLMKALKAMHVNKFMYGLNSWQ